MAAQNNGERLKLGAIILGFFALQYLFPNDFFLLQSFIVAWFILTGAEMIVSKKVMIALLVLAVLASATNPWFFIINFVFYSMVLGGFIISAFHKISGKFRSTE